MKKILVSSCLLGHAVRYDGHHSAVHHTLLEQLRISGAIVPFCPEVAAGLTIPRPAVEIITRSPLLLSDLHGEDFTAQFLNGAQQALEKAQAAGVCCALLKSKSPSCGFDQVYSGQFDDQLIAGDGVTAALFKKHNIPLFNEHQLGQLESFLQEY